MIPGSEKKDQRANGPRKIAKAQDKPLGCHQSASVPFTEHDWKFFTASWSDSGQIRAALVYSFTPAEV
jgi:hypothetical protein